MSVDDAQAYFKDYEKQMQTMDELMKGAEGPMAWDIQSEKVKIGGLPVLKVQMTFGLPAAKNIPDFAQMMEKMFGPGGKMTFFLAAADEKTVVAAYTNEKSFLRGLQAARQPAKSLSADQSIAKTAALLPPQAPFVGYWSPAGTVEFVNRLVSLFAPGEQAGHRLPKFPATQPVGCALTTAPNEVRTHTVVPADVLQAIGRYVIQVREQAKGI
jgi:hypothetical protein